MRILAFLIVMFSAMNMAHAQERTDGSTGTSCVRRAEATAITLRHLQSELMVAALSCDQRSAYNRFVLRFRPQLVEGGHALSAYFHRIGGGESALDEFVTKVANAAGLYRAANGEGYCNKAAQVFSDLEQAPESLLSLAAANLMPSVSTPQTCVESAAAAGY